MCVTDFNLSRRARRRGFTLVEVLICVAIIATLLALTVPGLRRAMEMREQVTCMASLHQIGIGLATYGVEHFDALPTHYESPTQAFDTFWMRNTQAADVNLGLLDYQIDDPAVYYCPTQTPDTSPSLAYDSPRNKWPKNKGKGKGNDKDKDKGKGKNGGDDEDGKDEHDGGSPGGNGNDDSGADVAETGAGLNSSYAVRARSYPASQPRWRLYLHSNKVLFSDFTGVDNWTGTERFSGSAIEAPHRGRGYNRLFGNGSGAWISADVVGATRAVNDQVPSAQQMHDYYQLLDVVP
jgi:prepilin-type N-terminal cleavage/methylation domain-containing protein